MASASTLPARAVAADSGVGEEQQAAAPPQELERQPAATESTATTTTTPTAVAAGGALVSDPIPVPVPVPSSSATSSSPTTSPITVKGRSTDTGSNHGDAGLLSSSLASTGAASVSAQSASTVSASGASAVASPSLRSVSSMSSPPPSRAAAQPFPPHIATTTTTTTNNNNHFAVAGPSTLPLPLHPAPPRPASVASNATATASALHHHQPGGGGGAPVSSASTRARQLQAAAAASGGAQQAASLARPQPTQEELVSQARAAVVASIENMVDGELRPRAAMLHANNAVIARQEADVAARTASLAADLDELSRLGADADRGLKPLGHEQNWAERTEMKLMRLEETLRLVREGDADGSGYGSGSDAASYSGSGSGSECPTDCDCSRAQSRRGSVGARDAAQAGEAVPAVDDGRAEVEAGPSNVATTAQTTGSAVGPAAPPPAPVAAAEAVAAGENDGAHSDLNSADTREPAAVGSFSPPPAPTFAPTFAPQAGRPPTLGVDDEAEVVGKGKGKAVDAPPLPPRAAKGPRTDTSLLREVVSKNAAAGAAPANADASKKSRFWPF